MNRYDSDFDIRPCSKSELALAYMPGLAPHSATNRLCQWMHRNAALERELADAGYRPRQKLLTSRQVDIIVSHLGEP